MIVLKFFDGIGNESYSNATLCEMLSIDQIKYILVLIKILKHVLLYRLQRKIMPDKIQIINSHKCRFKDIKEELYQIH